MPGKVTPCRAIFVVSCGYDLLISSKRVADAFAGLPEQEQSILILRLVLDLTDSEIGEALGLSRSTVQRRRTKSLKVLRALSCVLERGIVFAERSA